MTAYVRRTGAQKKKAILEKREAELRHHLAHASSAEKVAGSAERVRFAKLGVIKALLYEAEPAREEDDQNREVRARLNGERERWLGYSTDETVRLYHPQE